MAASRSSIAWRRSGERLSFRARTSRYCSTASTCAARGVGFLDAPVSGGQAGAEKGALTVMVGGDEASFGRRPESISHLFFGRIAHRGQFFELGGGEFAAAGHHAAVPVYKMPDKIIRSGFLPRLPMVS